MACGQSRPSQPGIRDEPGPVIVDEEASGLAFAMIQDALREAASTKGPDCGTPMPLIEEPGRATPAEMRALEDTCARFGLTAGRLALQTGDELGPAAAQICEAAGLQLRPGLVQAFQVLVLTAAALGPLAKRVRGGWGRACEWQA